MRLIKQWTMFNRLKVRLNLAAFLASKYCRGDSLSDGVAHTFMSAEAIGNLCEKQGWQVKVETRGQVGAGNEITQRKLLQQI